MDEPRTVNESTAGGGLSDAGAYQQLNRFALPPGFRGRPGWYVQLWWLAQATLFAWSPQFMYGWRRWLLRRFGARVGRGVIVRPTARVQFPWKLSLGDYCWIGDDVGLYSLGPIDVGAHAVVSQRSYLCTGSHDPADVAFPIFARPIVVEPEAWIATDVYVGPGVTIGHGTVVGARSSVYRDLPGGKIALGNPARVVRDRPRAGAPS